MGRTGESLLDSVINPWKTVPCQFAFVFFYWRLSGLLAV